MAVAENNAEKARNSQVILPVGFIQIL